MSTKNAMIRDHILINIFDKSCESDFLDRVVFTRPHESLLESKNSFTIAIMSNALFPSEVHKREIAISFSVDAHAEQKREGSAI
jgi:hypothetical protein